MKLTTVLCRLFFLYFLIISCQAGTPSIQSGKDDSVRAMKFSRNFPILDNNTGKFLGNEYDEAEIIFYKDFVLEKMPYVFTIHRISDSGVMEVDKRETRKSYFVYKKGNAYGYFTDSSRNLYFQRCPVDSIRLQFWPAHPFIEPLLESCNYFLLDSMTRHSGKFYYHTYFFQNKTDSLQKGTFTLQFVDSFPPVDYSLCKKLDTGKRMKLTGIEIFNESRYVKGYNVTIDAVRQNREMTLLQELNAGEIKYYFDYIKKKNYRE